MAQDGLHPIDLSEFGDGLYQIDFTGRMFGLIVEGGLVRFAAPSAKRFIGQKWVTARRWYEKNGAKIRKVNDDAAF